MTEATPFQFNLAPERLWQQVLPGWFSGEGSQIGLINVSLGDTKHPDVERKVLAEVGSYGRQLGHIGDVLEVLMDKLDLAGLEPEQKRAIAILRGELAEIANVKARELRR